MCPQRLSGEFGSQSFCLEQIAKFESSTLCSNILNIFRGLYIVFGSEKWNETTFMLSFEQSKSFVLLSACFSPPSPPWAQHKPRKDVTYALSSE